MLLRNYVPLFTFVAAGVAQRIGVKTLIDNGVDSIVFLNLLGFMGMFISALSFPESRNLMIWFMKNPLTLYSNTKKYPAAALTVVSELIGGVLQVITLSLLSVSNQSIISRGTELLGVVLLEKFVTKAATSRNQLKKHHMIIILVLLLIGSFLIPMLAQIGDLGFTAKAVFLVMLRSLLFSVQTVCEHISLHNYAFPSGNILLIESFGGLVLTVGTVWPIIFAFRDDKDKGFTESFKGTFEVIGETLWLFGLVLMMLFIYGFQNWARLNFIDRFSALAKEVAAALRPGAIYIVSTSLYYVFKWTDATVGEPLQLGPSLVTVSCFLVILLGNVLYFYWMPHISQLYLEGMKRVQDNSKETTKRVKQICKSGMHYQSSSIGCYALDESDYDANSPTFPLFRYVAEQYHETTLVTLDSPSHHRLPSRAKCLQSAWYKTVYDLDQVSSLRVRVARNLSLHSFVPSMTLEERANVAKMVRDALLADTETLGGSPWVLEDYENRPDLWPVREFRVMRAAGILDDWPCHRFIATKVSSIQKTRLRKFPTAKTLDEFSLDDSVDSLDEEAAIPRLPDTEKNKTNVAVTILVNEEDHLRLVVKVENPESAEDIAEAIAALSETEAMLERNLGSFAYNDSFGYLASCPTNVGTGFKISVRGATPVNPGIRDSPKQDCR